MKKIMQYAFILAMSAITSVSAQDFSKVDALVKEYPKSYSTPDELAQNINSDFKRDDEKVRAIYTWIATNIAYDVKTYFSQVGGERRVGISYRTLEEKAAKQKAIDDEFIRKALRNKMAVCQGYALLFKDVCLRLGIPCEFVPGTSKINVMNIGKMPGASDHAWNVVNIGGKWRLIDVTWAAGALDGNTKKFNFGFSGGYFFTDPEVFFLNHFPDDKKWLLIDKSEKDFAELPLYFRGYSTAPYTIVTPETGIITDINSNVIHFEILDLPVEAKVAYVFSSENVFVPANVVRKEHSATFDVLLSNKSKGFLMIYIDNRSIAAYKILK